VTRRTLRQAIAAELRFAGPAALLLFACGWLITFPIAYRHALRRMPRETP
jgi:hypothetical protein